ncbi:hypothetical protein DFH08DRAFT_904001 [Mycena albidolilacea]|uniref:Uncharacterized protein n=1 Tax=Mycena albidolilacea TaxID=1033008 RepID=A0AAD7E8U2_9AGAR|nr:hypothetical protein DFH08DRAFT_904001 [Mycena albidolilacea]
MSLNSPPVFPPELEREMLEKAAHLHPETIFNLLLVSRRVYKWINGMQYRTVTPKGDRWSCPVHALQQAIQSNTHPAGTFFHRNVRHVFIDMATPTDHIPQILDACNGIQNLMIINPIPLGSIIPSIAALQLRRLSLLWAAILRNMNPSQPMFASLTHVHMWDLLSVSNDTTSRVPPSFLAQLPVLTHFAALFRPTSRDFAVAARDILTTCKTLRVFMLNPLWETSLESLPLIDDVNFIYMDLGYRSVHLCDGWLAQTRGGIDFWARADAFVEKKRRGEIQPTSRCWIQPADGIPDFDSY